MKRFSFSLLHLSWAFLFSAGKDARSEVDGVDAGIELSLLNWRDAGIESVLVVEGDTSVHKPLKKGLWKIQPRGLFSEFYSIWHLFTGKYK